MTAPWLARAFLRLTVPKEELEAILGDLEEVHRWRVAVRGAKTAWLLTMHEAFGIGSRECRDRIADGMTGRWISGSEVRLAARLLLRTPMMTATSVFALAVGVAVATIGFTSVDAILNPRLPFEGGDRWVSIEALDAESRHSRSVEATLFERWRSESRTLVHVGAVRETLVNLALDEDRVAVVSAGFVTPSTMPLLPVRPLHGRAFTPADARPGAPPVVLLTEPLWLRLFEGDPDVVGRSIRLGDTTYTVVGVLPNEAVYPTLAELWVAWSAQDLSAHLDSGVSDTGVFGVLSAEAQPSDANDQLGSATMAWTDSRPDQPAATVLVRRVGEVSGGGAPSALLIAVLVGALGVVAGNVGNLVVARTAARRGELAVRSALGASRRRIVGQLAFEVLVMTVLASALGFAATRLLLGALDDRRTRDLPVTMDFSVSPRTLLFVFFATLFVATVAGLVPALRSTRSNASDALRAAGRGSARGIFGWFGHTMIVVQIALSIGILGAATMIHSGWLTQYVNPTLDVPAEQLWMAGLIPPTGIDRLQADALSEEYLRRLRELPDVRAVALSTHVPGTDADARMIEMERVEGEAILRIPTIDVGPGYFGAVGHTVLAGRGLRPEDYLPGAPAVGLVNADYASQLLSDRNPVGTRVRAAAPADGEPGPWIEIVGVVGGPSLSAADPERTGGLFLPLRNLDATQIIVRSIERPSGFGAQARATAFSVHPRLLVTGDAVLSERLGNVRRIYAVMGSILTGLGVVILVLSLVAVYALLSFEVTRRTREIGVRVALGAARADVVVPIARRVGSYVVVGGVVGTVFGLGLLWMAREMLVLRFPATGAGTFLTLTGLVLASALLAALVPVRRALGVRPIEALRAD
ncbi:MAG: FtsX-like permease family protein [Gemmatimonadota bacterium]